MGISVTEDRKLKENRGTGTHENYKPWVKIREFNSIGTACSYPDWKHGRMIQLLSQAELGYYLKLRWSDNVEDIREQFPLDLDTTTRIARSLGVRPMQNGRKRMITDFLVSLSNGSYIACSIEATREALKSNKRNVELHMIEYNYWKSKGIPWKVLFKEDLNPIEISNIKDIVSYYNMERVPDEIGLAKYLLAHKVITTDICNEIDFREFVSVLKENEIWKLYSYMLD